MHKTCELSHSNSYANFAERLQGVTGAIGAEGPNVSCPQLSVPNNGQNVVRELEALESQMYRAAGMPGGHPASTDMNRARTTRVTTVEKSQARPRYSMSTIFCAQGTHDRSDETTTVFSLACHRYIYGLELPTKAQMPTSTNHLPTHAAASTVVTAFCLNGNCGAAIGAGTSFKLLGST